MSLRSHHPLAQAQTAHGKEGSTPAGIARLGPIYLGGIRFQGGGGGGGKSHRAKPSAHAGDCPKHRDARRVRRRRYRSCEPGVGAVGSAAAAVEKIRTRFLSAGDVPAGAPLGTGTAAEQRCRGERCKGHGVGRTEAHETTKRDPGGVLEDGGDGRAGLLRRTGRAAAGGEGGQAHRGSCHAIYAAEAPGFAVALVKKREKLKPVSLLPQAGKAKSTWGKGSEHPPAPHPDLTP